jgi:glycosyltransferase involved in cell wall biosynthesis
MIKPKVSIVCVTYNQADFIAKTIDGFIGQKTNFEIEILIGDDSSTDETPQIIQKYADKHPNIKPVLRPKNIGVVPNFMDLMKSATGDYIALCEGDDYWNDKNKLQLQSDFLDSHTGHTICFHPVDELDDSTGKKTTYPEPANDAKYDLNELLIHNFIPTCSVMYRRQNYDEVPLDILPLDWYLHLLHAQNGEIGFINNKMAVYRRHPGSIWWESDKDRKKFWLRHATAHLKLYGVLLSQFGSDPDRRIVIANNAGNAFNEIRYADRDLFIDSLVKYPEFATVYIENLAERVEKLDEHAQNQEKHIDSLQIQLELSKNEAELLRKRLEKTASHRIKKIIKRSKK